MVSRSPIPLEPETPEWFKRFMLRNEQSWVPLVPSAPQRLLAVATVDLPPAASWPYCLAYDLTLGTVVSSDGVSWT